MLYIAAAMAQNGVIGRGDKIPWRLPADQKKLKNMTMGKTIIMGRKTFETLNGILSGRLHVVLTRDMEFQYKHDMVKTVHTVKEASKYWEGDKEAFVFGGSEIYRLLAPYSSKIYLTKISEDIEGDVFFPVEIFKDFHIKSIEKGIKNEKNPHDFEYIIYERGL